MTRVEMGVTLAEMGVREGPPETTRQLLCHPGNAHSRQRQTWAGSGFFQNRRVATVTSV